MIKTILVATSNPHKVEEIAAILGSMGVVVESLAQCGVDVDEPVEDGDTFAANARIKAEYYARVTGRACLADDSGLEVDALGGEPGVHSARYAGVGEKRDERDSANNAKLLTALKDVPRALRTARFVCAMCLADGDGQVVAETRGTFEGVIVDEPRGSNGFGYDPLLYVVDAGCTSAELEPTAKNARSHRGQATRQMAELLGAMDM